MAQPPRTSSRSEETVQEQNAIERLVIGDQYTIVIKRKSIEKTYVGELVRMNARWLALRDSSEEETVYGSPHLSQMPHFDRPETNTLVPREKFVTWIPREIATVRGRVRARDKHSPETLRRDAPTPTRGCYVQFIDQGTTNQTRADLTNVESDRFAFTKTLADPTPQGVPVAKDVPVVGGLFRRKGREIHKQLRYEEILSLTMIDTEYEPVDTSLAKSN
jgi:hypothetical protein